MKKAVKGRAKQREERARLARIKNGTATAEDFGLPPDEAIIRQVTGTVRRFAR